MSACPHPLVLARAVSEGAGPELDLHLATCASCRAAWDGDRRTIELARSLEVRLPPADRREELRTAILAASLDASPAAPAARSRRWWIGGVALAAAATVALAVGLGRGSSPAPRPAHAHGTIRAEPGARYVATASPDEIVTLHDGTIAVEVEPLHPGERFRVVTADAEVEVRGTAFDVEARLGRLESVIVHHGVVEVRPLAGAATTLRAGQSWTPPGRSAAATAIDSPAAPATATDPLTASAPPSIAATAPAPLGPPPPRHAGPPPPAISDAPPTVDAPAVPDPTPAPTARPAQDLAYDQAWSAMRAAQFAAAATAFARVVVLDPDGPLAEDAAYWYAVALARAHRPEATTAFVAFLDRHPRSPHAGEASAMLGWILADVDRAEAARRFRAALHDPSPAVRDSARAGLAAL